MLGSWICPIEQTPVIIQVASQLLPRVTPEKIHIEVSHCLGLDQDTHSYTLKCLWMVQLPICHGTTSLPLLHPPLATSNPICLHSTSSTPTPLQLQSILAQLMQAMLCPLSD